MTTQELVEETYEPLTAVDRCDGCGSRAYLRVMVAGTDLLFCAHHANKNEAKLKDIAEEWQDDRHMLFDEVVGNSGNSQD